MAIEQLSACIISIQPRAGLSEGDVSLLARICAKLRASETGCWEWTRSVGTTGYGRISALWNSIGIAGVLSLTMLIVNTVTKCHSPVGADNDSEQKEGQPIRA